ncbi:hypothetical protein [Methylomagnum sp.]
MAPLPFVITLACTGYLVRELLKTVDEINRAKHPAPPPSAPPLLTAEAPPAPCETAAASAPAKTEAAVPILTKPAPLAKVAASSRLRNPVTGETATVSSNYQFAKRWIKQALVTEGLLDHIYQQKELDKAVRQRAAQALNQLRSLDKYQP